MNNMKKKNRKIKKIEVNHDEQAYFIYFKDNTYMRLDCDTDFMSPEDVKNYVESQIEINENI